MVWRQLIRVSQHVVNVVRDELRHRLSSKVGDFVPVFGTWARWCRRGLGRGGGFGRFLNSSISSIGNAARHSSLSMSTSFMNDHDRSSKGDNIRWQQSNADRTSLSDCVTFGPNLDILVVIHQKCFHSAPLCSHLVHRIAGCDDFTDDGGSSLSLSLSFLTFLSSASLSVPSLCLF